MTDIAKRLVLGVVAALYVLLPHSYVSFAADFSGPVIFRLDGNTIKVLHKRHLERIRLSGIDSPEKGQAFGKRAKQAASELVFGKDKDWRTIADVLLPMEPTAITRWSKTAGAGGIGSKRQEIRYWSS